MQSLFMKKILLTASAFLVLGCTAGPAAGSAASSQKIPNPLVPYGTYRDAASVLGFTPLTLSRDSGYAFEGITVIGGQVADLSFVRLGQTDTRVRLRTALKKDNADNNLSGIYGAKWEMQRINETEVRMARLSPQSFAAAWESGKYAFSVQAAGLEEAAFRSLLTNSLVEDTEHYFISLQKEKESGKRTSYSNL